jgi:deferrochelatase/peroxidase EfeB
MLPFADAQRIVLSGYPYERVRHFCLRVEAPAAARTFFAACAQHVTRADQKLDQSAVTLAFTRPGLEALEFPEEYLGAFRRFARGFFDGAAARGAEHLGDTGRNEAPRWEHPFRDKSTHALLSVYADDCAKLDERVATLRALPAADSVSGWHLGMDGAHRNTNKSSRREPFGFRDGISQPRIVGWKQKQNGHYRDQLDVPAGEFLLGHSNSDGENLWKNTTLHSKVREFVANGCFGALRKMQQHVDEFTKIDPLLRAKMCGRWPSGALVRPDTITDPIATNGPALNAFDFTHDPAGAGCPFGSHIRRMNPRSDPVAIKTPTVMRRGIPYKTDAEEGMLGLFLCANLERQFEFLLRDWVRSPPMNPQHDTLAADPLIGGNPGAIFRDGTSASPTAIPNLGSFVTTRGTLYCFFPSATALRSLGMITEMS